MRPDDFIRGDRREERRYHYVMDLRFTFRVRGVTHFGSGKTQDLSRYGVRFTSENPPPDGSEVEVRIAWPFLLQNVCPLELLVFGKVMKTDDRGTIVQMNDYEFRTCGERSFDEAASGNERSSIMA
jgi:hypothetical protein